MNAREFAEWIAYDQIEPLPGGNREDQRAGVIASAIVNQHKKRGHKGVNWSDFFPPYEKRKPNTDWRGLLTKVIGLNAVLGGTDKRKNTSALDDD